MIEIHVKLLESINDIFDNYLDKIDDNFIIEICDYLLDGNLFVCPGYVPQDFTYEKELKFDIKDFNWDLLYPSIPSLCQLYLHGFATIKYLIQGYELTLNYEYLDMASELIKSWLEYEPNSKNKFTWYDHSVSDRVLVMIYFSLIIKKNDISKYDQLISDINNSLRKHGDFLYNDDNYTLNNHGTMVDRALYIVAVYLNDEISIKYKEKAINRLKDAVRRDFSDKMVNLENSTHYHLFSSDLFITIEKSLLNRFEDSLGDPLAQSAVESCTDFMIHLSKPDLSFPMIGDGSKWNLKSIEKLSLYPHIKNYSPLKWILTRGKSGYKPKELFKVYGKEGYAFFRNSWDMKKQNETTYVSFKSGYSVKFHKHGDDLSFTLFAKGKDIFVDSGTYTYESGDFRRFFMYALAHNTIVVDDQTYPFIMGNSDDTGIIGYGEEEDYYYVVGKNDMYSNVGITRSLYYLKSGEIIIIDDIQSQDIHKYSQYYHLDSELTISDIDVKFEEDNTNVKISDSDVDINISQMGHCDVKVIKGDKNKAEPGIISKKFGDLEETTSIKFSINSKKARFVTLITVNDASEKKEKKCYIDQINSESKIEELVISESKKELRIPLADYSRDAYHVLIVEQTDENLFTFTIGDTNVDELFAWYVLKNGEKIDVIWYSSDPVLEYLFTEPGEYEIKYFVKKDEEKKMYDFSEIIIVTNEDTYFNKSKFEKEVNKGRIEFVGPENVKIKENSPDVNELNYQIMYYQENIACLQEKQNKLLSEIKSLEKESKYMKKQLKIIANTKPYRMAYILRRFSHEFLNGNKNNKKNFIMWIYCKFTKKEGKLIFKYNPLMKLAKK